MPPLLQADEVILLEGKTIYGKITQENPEEVTILIRPNMFLRVEKDKIQKIVRPQPKPEKNIIRYVTQASTSAAASTPTAVDQSFVIRQPEPSPKQTEYPPLLEAQERIEKNEYEVGVVRVQELVSYKPFFVNGKTFDDIRENIFDERIGKGPKQEGRRRASQSEWKTAWLGEAVKGAHEFAWKTALVTSTLTVVLPSWKAPSILDLETIKEWNSFSAKIDDYEKGRIKIYKNSLKNFAESLGKLTASTEENLRSDAQKLFNESKIRTEKRLAAYERRKEFRGLPSIKK